MKNKVMLVGFVFLFFATAITVAKKMHPDGFVHEINGVYPENRADALEICSRLAGDSDISPKLASGLDDIQVYTWSDKKLFRIDESESTGWECLIVDGRAIVAHPKR